MPAKFTISLHGEPFRIIRIAIGWVIRVDDGWYFVTTTDGDVDRETIRFLRDRMRNVGSPPRSPTLIASKDHPLLLAIRGQMVRAWPAFRPRNQWSRTYVNPASGVRVAAVRGPVWMFETPRMGAEGGDAGEGRTVAAVRAMAERWLANP